MEAYLIAKSIYMAKRFLITNEYFWVEANKTIDKRTCIGPLYQSIERFICPGAIQFTNDDKTWYSVPIINNN